MPNKTKSTKPYVIVRDNRAGVYAGFLESKNLAEKTAALTSARHIWQWRGRLSTADIAARGVGQGSKVATLVSRIQLADIVSIIEASEEAKQNIMDFAPWEH